MGGRFVSVQSTGLRPAAKRSQQPRRCELAHRQTSHPCAQLRAVLTGTPSFHRRVCRRPSLMRYGGHSSGACPSLSGIPQTATRVRTRQSTFDLPLDAGEHRLRLEDAGPRTRLSDLATLASKRAARNAPKTGVLRRFHLRVIRRLTHPAICSWHTYSWPSRTRTCTARVEEDQFGWNHRPAVAPVDGTGWRGAQLIWSQRCRRS